jgi:hypothetical protein
MPRAAKPVVPGDRFGSWTVNASAEPKRFPSGQYQKQFTCQCDCGNSGLVTYSALTRGKSMSCGCAAERDYTGRTIGRITFLSDTGRRLQGSTRVYVTRCNICSTERERTVIQVKLASKKPCTCEMNPSQWAALGGVTHGMYGTPAHTSWQGMIARCSNPKHPSFKNYGGRGIHVAEAWQGEEGFQAFFDHLGPRPDGCSLDRIDAFGHYEPGNVRWASKELQEANKRPRMDPTEIEGVFKDRVNGGFYVKFDTKLEARFAYAMSRAKGPHPVQMQRAGYTPESAAEILAETAWLHICGVG